MVFFKLNFLKYKLLLKLMYFLLFSSMDWSMLVFFLIFFSMSYNNFYKNFYSIDNISITLGILSMIILLMSFLSVNNLTKKLMFLTVFSGFISIIYFFSMHLIYFYIFFEMGLIPILFLILGWGYQVERLLASFLLLLYTSIFSFPFIMVLLLYSKSMSFFFLLNSVYNSSIFFIFALLLVFLVKTPIYFFHFWLPKAHVEASVTGSIILAGVLLKMGGYGIYRFLVMFSLKYMYTFFWIFFFASVMSLLICTLQSDFKAMIAFSSVSHMSLMIFSMIQFSFFSYKGSLFLMLIHGVSSSLLFYLMNFMYYFFLSRVFYFVQFVMALSKTFSMMIFLGLLFNIALPPLMSFFSEVLMLTSLVLLSKYMMVYIVFLSLVSCYYSFFMLMNMMYGKLKYSFWGPLPSLKDFIFMGGFMVFMMNLLLMINFF